MKLMYEEIYKQATIIRSIKPLIEPTLQGILKAYKVARPTHIIVAARGSSDNACNYFKYLVEVYLGIPVSFAAPSVVTLYGTVMDYHHSMVIGVSQSGQAQDVLAILKMAKKQNAIVISITNDEASPMAKIADHHLDMNAGIERSVAATKTFMAELYSLGLLVATLEGKKLAPLFETVPTHLESLYSMESEIFKATEHYQLVNESYVLARGYLYSVAQESALKIQETCYINAKAYSISDFHHGPFAVLDSKSHVILFMNSGKTYQDTFEMAKKIKSTGAHLTILSDVSTLELSPDLTITMPSIDEVLAPFTYIFVMQLFAYKASILRGNNPDVPRGLKKITITK